MLTRLRVGDKEEDGFTLIELLVVIIIIGILAAIAIPVFLRQKQQAVDASVKSDLRNTARVMETYYVDNNVYPTDISQVSSDVFPSAGTTIMISTVGAAPGTYCLVATNPRASATYSYDSDKGGLLGPGVACS